MNFVNPITFRRSEIPMLLGAGSVEVSYGTVKPVVTEESISYWAAGSNFSAGTYRVRYVSGALRYFSNSALFLNYPDGHGFYILAGSEQVPFPASTTEGFATQSETEAANEGASVSFEHPGGPIGITLIDLPYADNAVADSSPVFELSVLETRSTEIEAEYISPLFGDLSEEDDIYTGNGGEVSEL